MNLHETAFTAVDTVIGDPPAIRYTSGLTCYDEALIDGRWVGRYWSGKGFVEPQRLLNWIPPAARAPDATAGLDLAAFGLEVDGQSLHYGWELVETAERAPARPGTRHAAVVLRSTLLPITVQVHTETDGTGFLTRWLDITNDGDCPVALGAAWPWCGVIQSVKDWLPLMGGNYGAPVFDAGYMTERMWGSEGAFDWQPLPSTALRIESRTGKSGHGTPFFVARNNATGAHIVGGLAWSGNWAVELTCEQRAGPDAWLHFRIGPTNPPPQRIIAAGETVGTPKAHLAVLETDFDGAIQAWHRHLRNSVLRPEPEGKRNLVTFNHWSYHEHEMTEERLKFEVDVAAEVGAEMFIVDAGWFGNAGSNWWQAVGDWVTGDRLPNGLEPVFDHARRQGLLCGMWFDLERMGTLSAIAQQHPEWRLQRYGRPTDTGDIDLTNPDAVACVEQALSRAIDRYQLDLFRLDYNTMPFEGGQALRDGRWENTTWRYYENVYALYDRIAARYPNMLMENCSGGGGRTDIGLLSRFHYTWITDWQVAPRAQRIFNGMSMALPPERIDRNAGVGQDGHQRGDLDFLVRSCMLGHFTLLGMYPWYGQGNPDHLNRIRHHVQLYKEFIRPILPNCRIVHHTPVLKTKEPQGWAVIEETAEDQSRAVAGLFRLAGPAEDTYLLRLRGIDAGRRYRVTMDNGGETFERDGDALKYRRPRGAAGQAAHVGDGGVASGGEVKG